MISDAELDRILGRWLADGGERAPQRDIDAALARVAATRQRRPWRSARGPVAVPRWAWIAAAVMLVASLGFAFAVGTGLVSLQWTEPERPVQPAPAIVDDVVPLREIVIEDRASRVSVPSSWVEIEAPCCDYREFAGTDPEGHLSVGHESPYTTSICIPECHAIEMPLTIPYSADRQLEGLRAGIGAVLGSDAWEPLADGVIPDLEHGARLEASGQDEAGRTWRRVVYAGLRDRNVVAIAWSQPEAEFDPVLLGAVLDALELPAAPVYTDGDLIAWDERGPFSLRLPGFWWTAEQPTIDGVGLSGAYRFGEGNVVASMGSEDGELGWCDPDCTRLTGMTSLEALEAAVSDGRDLVATPEIVGGEPGLVLAADGPDARRYALAMHGGRPFAMFVDTGDWEVASDIPDQIIASVTFAAPPSAPTGTTYDVGDGLLTITLPAVWRPTSANGAAFAAIAGEKRLSVRLGSPDGTVQRCASPAGPWEACEPIRVTTLEELVVAVTPGPDDDHGVGPPIARREDRMIEDIPVVVLRIQAYEYPARGGQEVVYVVAFVDDRPVVLRFHTSANRFPGMDPLLEGISFADPAG